MPIEGGYPNPLDPSSGCPFHPRCAQAMPACGTTLPPTSVRAGGWVECHLYAG